MAKAASMVDHRAQVHGFKSKVVSLSFCSYGDHLVNLPSNMYKISFKTKTFMFIILETILCLL